MFTLTVRSKRIFRVFLVGVLLCLTLVLFQHHTRATGEDALYVAPGGDCGGASPCYVHPQDAVDAANDGDVVKVAGGTYTGVDARPRCDVTTTGVVTQVVYISKTVTIRGGYTTANWDSSDPESYPTTLDAHGQGRVLYITGAVSPTIEGLCLTGGNASGFGGSPWGNDAGGGVYLYLSEVTLANDSINSNMAYYGGGLYLESSNAALSGNTMYDNRAVSGDGLFLNLSATMLVSNTICSNTATSSGGGLYLYGHSDATLSGNTICSNTAPYGGGLYLGDSVTTLSGNTVYNNASKYWGGGLCLRDSVATLSSNTVYMNTAEEGAGLCLRWRSTITLTNTSIYSNTAEYGGGLSLVDSSSATISGSTICSNTAEFDGGGLYLDSSSTTLNGNAVCSNTAARGGGGLYLYESDAILNGNTVCSNVAQAEGGGLHLHFFSDVTLINNLIADNQAGTLGGGLYIEASTAHLVHSTIARNTGSGIYATEYRVAHHGAYYSSVALTNTILVSHTTGITVSEGNTTTLEATLWGNTTDWGGAGTIIIGTRNLWGGSGFVNPGGGNYHIGPTSVAIDTGVDADVTIDIDGDPRPIGAGFDIGADEYSLVKTIYLPLVLKR